MNLQHATGRPRGRVPEPNRVVPRGRGQLLAVGREGHRLDRARITLQRLLQSPRGRVPEANRLAVGGRGQLPAVRRGGRHQDPVRMALERLLQSTPIRLHFRHLADPPGGLVFELPSNGT